LVSHTLINVCFRFCSAHAHVGIIKMSYSSNSDTTPLKRYQLTHAWGEHEYHAANKRTSKNSIAAEISNKSHNSLWDRSRDHITFDYYFPNVLAIRNAKFYSEIFLSLVATVIETLRISTWFGPSRTQNIFVVFWTFYLP